jgi:hypothetical protein
MASEKRDMDEPVNVDMDPEDALRVLLMGKESQEDEPEDSEESGSQDPG